MMMFSDHLSNGSLQGAFKQLCSKRSSLPFEREPKGAWLHGGWYQFSNKVPPARISLNHAGIT